MLLGVVDRFLVGGKLRWVFYDDCVPPAGEAPLTEGPLHQVLEVLDGMKPDFEFLEFLLGIGAVI